MYPHIVKTLKTASTNTISCLHYNTLLAEVHTMYCMHLNSQDLGANATSSLVVIQTLDPVFLLVEAKAEEDGPYIYTFSEYHNIV